jgi:hypothetical protein
MKSRLRNNWRQPAVPTDVVVEVFADVRAVYSDRPADSSPRLWSPPGAAGMHGVLWFVALQQAALEAFPDRRPLITLDCGDRADLAHAALREGLQSICFRGSPALLAKLRAIADTLGAVVETRHPALPE